MSDEELDPDQQLDFDSAYMVRGRYISGFLYIEELINVALLDYFGSDEQTRSLFH